MGEEVDRREWLLWEEGLSKGKGEKGGGGEREEIEMQKQEWQDGLSEGEEKTDRAKED